MLEFNPLLIELREELYQKKFFLKSKREFNFSEIRKFIQVNGNPNWELNYSQRMDNVSIPTCFVSARLKSALGDDWQNFKKTVAKTHKDKEKNRTYTIEDIWHILFTFDDEEYLSEFLSNTLKLEEYQVKELTTLFNSLPVGYANLSIKAINNILPFLHEGHIYTEAVILAKIPEILGEKIFTNNKDTILSTINEIISKDKYEKAFTSISNRLISKYYSLDYENRFAWKDFKYKLNNSDFEDIKKAAIEQFGEKTWNQKSDIERQEILSDIATKYQSFFADEKRGYIKQPFLIKKIKEYIIKQFPFCERKLDKIYHPSQTAIYPQKEGQQFLLSPKTGALKNPMAYKTLYKLRDVINYLIETERIDNETRIVVEIARSLNDANKRWAIETYQRDREAENKEFAAAIQEYKNRETSVSADEINKVRLLIEQHPDCMFNKNRFIAEQEENYKAVIKEYRYKKDENSIKKYRLWLEQGMQCIYTGKLINITTLFNDNEVDFEHTIPRSKSFDNSLANLTVCDYYYNRNIKNNRMPTECPNYGKDYTDINGITYTDMIPRLKKWEEKVEQLHKNIQFWIIKSRIAKDREEKNDAIREYHLWKFEYDYWKNKLDRFTRIEIPQGFINRQLTDKQIITKHALHYLKTVFNKVDVIKGENTAQFRKIYGIQYKLEEKDRKKHSHHAIDAAILTLIPSDKKREKILKRSYEYEERPENRNKQYHEKPFSTFSHSMIEDIEKNILVNNLVDKDQTLTPGKKIVRKRGRVVWIDRDKRIPKIAQGDSIRGELHKQTYYGKIRVVERDENQSPKKESDGSWIFSKGKDEFKYVLRIPIEQLTDLKKLVNPELSEMIQRQLNGRTLKKAIADGFFMLDKKGNKVNKIRRVRILQAVNPMNIKKQTYTSSKEYKNYYYAKNAENIAFALYKKDKDKSLIVARNLYEISTFHKANTIKNINELFENVIHYKGVDLPLYHVLMPGLKVLFFEKYKEELKDADNLSNHLYFIKRLYQASRGNIQFQHHLEARDDEQLKKDYPKDEFGEKGVNGFSKFTTQFIAPRLLLSPKNFNFIIEGKGFEMKIDGTIEFKF